MNFLKRAILSLKRQLFKTILLFTLIFLLGILMSAAISIRNAIINTDYALRQRLPAIATIHVDEHRLQAEQGLSDEWIYLGSVAPTLIREIGTLPYVRAFDYTAWGHHFFSETLIRTFNTDLFLLAEHPQENAIDRESLTIREGVPFEQFTLKGIQHPDVLDIEAGLIDLVLGRVFCASEIADGDHVTLVSQSFLESNNLSLGDYVMLEYRIYDEFTGRENSFDYLIATKVFELEIIGVFDHTLSVDAILSISNINEHIRIVNQLYVPNRLIESVIPFYFDTFMEMNPEILRDLIDIEDIEDMIRYENIVFLLNDPLDLESFVREANHRLPEFWVTSDLSSTYADMSSSMTTMREIADALAISTSIATIMTLGLLILICIKERKLEMGVYLALGERKGKIIGQILVEILVVSIFSISLALILGHFLASEISNTMIRTDLIRQSEMDRITFVLADTPEALGFRHEITHEEMLELYDTSLSLIMVLIFYGTTFAIISISIIPPVYYLVKLQPKSVLIKGSIG